MSTLFRAVKPDPSALEFAGRVAGLGTLAEAIRTGDERNYQRVLDRLQPYKDKVALHERNIEALKKEIGNLK